MSLFLDFKIGEAQREHFEMRATMRAERTEEELKEFSRRYDEIKKEYYLKIDDLNREYRERAE